MTDGGSGWSPLWSAFLAVLMLGVLRLLYNLWMAPAAAERADTSYLAGAYERALGEQERLKSVVRDLEERARSPLPEISVEHAELGHRWLDDPDEPLLAEGPGERILVERPGSDYCGWWISGFRIVNRGTRSIDLKFTLLAEWPNRAAWKSMDFRDPNWTRWWGVMTNLEPRDDYLQPGTPVHIASDGAYGPITLPFIMLMTLGAWDCVDVFLSITDNVSGKTLPPIRMDSNGSVDV
jgi:hypothetical protein